MCFCGEAHETLEQGTLGEPICLRTLSSHWRGPFKCISIQHGVDITVWRLKKKQPKLLINTSALRLWLYYKWKKKHIRWCICISNKELFHTCKSMRYNFISLYKWDKELAVATSCHMRWRLCNYVDELGAVYDFLRTINLFFNQWPQHPSNTKISDISVIGILFLLSALSDWVPEQFHTEERLKPVQPGHRPAPSVTKPKPHGTSPFSISCHSLVITNIYC